MNVSVRRRRTAMAGAAIALALVAAACGDDDAETASTQAQTSQSTDTAAATTSASGVASSDDTAEATAATTNEATADDMSASAEQERLKLGMVLILTNIPFGQQIADGAKAAAEDVNADVQITGPTSIDPALAQKQASDLVAAGLDGLSVAPFPTEAWPRALSELKDKLENTITHNVPPTDGSGVDLYVGVNDIAQGRALATETIKNAGWTADTTGKILLGQCVPGDTGVLASRMKGMKEVFERELPNAEVKGPIQVSVDPNQNTSDWENVLKANPDPLAAGGTCDQDGESLYKLKTASGDDYAVFAFETPPNTVKGIQDGTIIANVSVDWWLEGYQAIRILAERARGNDVAGGWVDTGYTVIDQSNVDAVIERNASEEAARAWYAEAIADFEADLASHTHPLSDQLK
jgi:ribose transport system substrate-binding protein